MLIAAVAMPSSAQDRGALIRGLRSASDFRTRVQAAFALGNTREVAVLPHLEHALRNDAHPAVRAAAATAIGRVGSRVGLSSLRRARSDSSAAVRVQVEHSIRLLSSPPGAEQAQASALPASAQGPAGVYPSINVVPSAQDFRWNIVRTVVLLGDMSNRSGFAGEVMAEKLRGAIARRLQVMRGVAWFPSTEQLDAAATREIRRRRLPQMRLDGNVLRVDRRHQQRDLSVRCEVSLMLLQEPDRVMRGMLQGAATGTAERHRNRPDQERRLADQALEGAVQSAMSNAYQAILSAAGRR